MYRWTCRKVLSVLCLNYPADLIKDALGGDDDVALGTIDLQASPRWLLVWRVERRIMVKHVAPAAGAFLQALLSGRPANQALAAAVSQSSFEVATEEIQRDVFAASFCRDHNTYSRSNSCEHNSPEADLGTRKCIGTS